MIFDLLAGILRGVDPSKKMRNVRTIHFHPVSRREHRHVSENEELPAQDVLLHQLRW